MGGSDSGNGWLQTKKPGRDDDLISKARRTAMEERKKLRAARRRKKSVEEDAAATEASANKKVTKKQPKKKTKKTNEWIYDDDDDDDEEEWTSEKDDNEDDIIAVNDDNANDSVAGSASSSVSDNDIFNRRKPGKKGIPPKKAVSTQQSAADFVRSSPSKKPSITVAGGGNRRLKRFLKPVINENIKNSFLADSDDDDEILGVKGLTSTSTTKPGANSFTITGLTSTSPEKSGANAFTLTAPSVTTTPTVLKKNDENNDKQGGDGNDNNDDSNDDLEDTPEPVDRKPRAKRKFGETNGGVAHLNSNTTKLNSLKRKKERNKKEKHERVKGIDPDALGVEDENEAIALAHVLEQSQKEYNEYISSQSNSPEKDRETSNNTKMEEAKKKAIISLDSSDDEDENQETKSGLKTWRKYKDKKKQETKKKAVISLDSSDYDEENNQEDGEDEDEQDIYECDDEDAQAAGHVLQTANELSKQIIRNMTSWAASQQPEQSDQQSARSAIPMGMIVDGALALNTINCAAVGGGSSSASDHKFITKEEMKAICPDVTLADYQLIGVNWMALLHRMKCEVAGSTSKKDKSKLKSTSVNGVLADSMGLGKTVQTITFLAWLKDAGKKSALPVEEAPSSPREETQMMDCDEEDDVAEMANNDADADENWHYPHLVVVPSSVLSNWAREFEKFAPHLNVVTYHGSMAEREQQQQELKIQLPSQVRARKKFNIQPIDVIICPVTYFQKEKSDDRAFLRKFKFDYMVVDEAHLLKNAKGLRYKTMDRFRTRHRLLLTGTPVQNSPKELLALLCFLMPLFSRNSGGDEYGGDQENDGGENMLQYFVNQEGCSDEVAYRKLKQLFAPFVLRRKKEDVLSQILPPKTHKVELVTLDPTARSLYDSVLSDHVESKKKSIPVAAREHLFTQLRKAAHHPLLIRARHKTPAEKEEIATLFLKYGAFKGDGATRERIMEELDKYNDFQIHLTALDLIEENKHRRNDLQRYVLEEEDLFCSAKFARLRQLLPELVADGHRILIFSIWTSCLDLLSCLMDYLGLKYLRMEGSTQVNERQGLIDQFTKDETIPVFLLSTKACGLGINLTAADTCIMHDLDFNPFNDLQAEDRCHRIGATKPVTIIKMVSKDTVDEDIYTMQQRKEKMNAAILESNSSEWNKKEAAKEKAVVLQTAVDRFLRSPTKQKKLDRKENTVFERDNL